MRDAENLEKIAHLKEILTIETPQIDESAQTLAGMSFVVTGSLNHYASRNDLKEVIEEKGGKVTGSVTGKTTCLINNDITSTSSKNKKAKESFLLEEEQRLKKILGTDVTIRSSSQNKGTIQISFSSLDEYQRIINSLK